MIADFCSRGADPGLVAGLLSDVDCQASSLVERGYMALSAPGTATAILLTSLMTIAVALYGYRLLLGRGLLLADVVALAVKLGVVLLIAASWASWQGLAYDTLARAPTRVASELVVSIDAPAPLEGVQTALDQLEAGNVGWRTRAGIASPLVGGAPTAAMALNTSSFLLTLSTLGLLVISRIVLALLLAIAPVMAGFLLFDATRGLVEGWLRSMVAAALIPLGVLVLAAIELAVLLPLIDRMLAEQSREIFEISSVTPVALVVIIFSLAILAAARALSRIAGGIRLGGHGIGGRVADAVVLTNHIPDERITVVGGTTNALRPPVVRALEGTTRRESQGDARRTVAAAMRSSSRAEASPAVRIGATPVAAPIDSSAVTPIHTVGSFRRPLPRASRAAARRDS